MKCPLLEHSIQWLWFPQIWPSKNGVGGGVVGASFQGLLGYDSKRPEYRVASFHSTHLKRQGWHVWIRASSYHSSQLFQMQTHLLRYYKCYTYENTGHKILLLGMLIITISKDQLQ